MLPLIALPALAAAMPVADQRPDITITDRRDAATASRLALAPEEIPATLDTVTQAAMQAKGLRTAVEVYASVPGVVAGLLPGEPASASIRGFSTGAVSYLFDGMRVADSAILNRNYDSFNFARIDVLKGPASILYGDGALAGAINLVPKTPAFDRVAVDALAGFGSFDTARVGVGANLPISSEAAFRTDLSHSRTAGYVDDTDARTLQSTSSLALRPSADVSILLALDYYGDRAGTPYQGTPLVPLTVARDPSGAVAAASGYVLDRAMRNENYNVADGRMESDAWWGRARVTWAIGGGWTLTDEASLYRGDRRWTNSEDFTYNAATGLLDRNTTKITHDHDFWSNRAFLGHDSVVGGLRNRFSVGAEYGESRFATVRRFGQAESVALFDPVRGNFPADVAANFPGTGNRANFDSSVGSWAVFGEDALNLTPEWLVLGGLRFDHIDLDRRIADLNAGTATDFGRNFRVLSGRLGTVYEISPATQLYAQYSHAITPVGSLLLSNVLRASLDLTRGDSVEAGMRSGLLGDRLTLGAAGYWIRQSGIVTRDPARPSVQVQGGVQSSRGFELSAVAALSRTLSLDANAAILDARFDRLTGAGGVDLAGNRPVNVPERTANLTLAWTPVPAVTLSGAARHVGDIYTSTANTVRVDGYTTFEAAAAWRLRQATLGLRVRNLGNRFYAYWSGYSATQVYVAAPRSVDVTLTAGF